MSHFSTIKTQLKEVEPLIKALSHFGYSINQEEKFVKGYKGQFTAVDISMHLPGDTQVGFKWDNNSNTIFKAGDSLVSSTLGLNEIP